MGPMTNTEASYSLEISDIEIRYLTVYAAKDKGTDQPVWMLFPCPESSFSYDTAYIYD